MASLNYARLRDLISAVRQCKTSAEERALIKRESALIREAFHESRPFVRTRNMLKLLYISMLGYPTEFGQVEVVSLLAQADFSGKRVGYLTLQMVLDENDEVLTLSENHMKKDLMHGPLFIQSMALNVVANIASEVMARDMLEEITRLIKSPNVCLKKKACLAAIRIIKKVPEYIEVFLEAFADLFLERDSGVLLCTVTLVNECLQQPDGKEFLPRYRQMANAAVRTLKQLVLSSRITDQDVFGISNPFLQIKILEFMRLIGKGSAVTSEALNNILAQVLTNTDSSRNVGCAIHYECVRTIYAIESDEGLRALGVTTVSRFLSSNDNNLRFVALQSLLDYASCDADAVREHQNTILDCLKDSDMSIRRRALELIVALVNENNVRLLTPDLLSYLTICAEEMRTDVTEHLCQIIEEKSPTNEWRVEFSLRLLHLAKHLAPVEFATRFITLLLNESTEVQRNAVASMWDEVSCPFDALHHSRKAFLVAAVWCTGEYVDLLIDAKQVSVDDVATCIAEITNNSEFNTIKCYGLTALMKIASKFPSVKTIALPVYGNYATSLDCELQQRACEYTTLLESFPEEAAFSFARMPPIHLTGETKAEVQPVPVVNLPPEILRQQAAVALDDLFNIGQKADAEPTIPVRSNDNSKQGVVGIDDLFGPSLPPSSNTASYPSPLGQVEFTPPPPTEVELGGGKRMGTGATEFQVFECDDLSLKISAVFQGVISANVIVTSRLPTAIEQLSFQVAVPKTSVLDIACLPSTVIPPHGQIVQRLTVDNTGSSKNPRLLLVRIKLLYTVNGVAHSQLLQVSQEV